MRGKAMPDRPVEFGAGEIEAAVSHIMGLPPNFTRVNIEVWEDGTWRFVFGDSRGEAPKLLDSLTNGRRFRVQGVRLSGPSDGSP
jgi:hypothetical protein